MEDPTIDTASNLVATEEDAIAIDFEALDESLLAHDQYWSPTREKDHGAFGSAEMITASANLMDIGDVGNAEWIAARRLPFRDEELDEIGITGRLHMRYAYEDHPFFPTSARRYELKEGEEAKEAYEQHFLDNDPAVKWAVQESEALKASGLDTVEKQIRFQELSHFVMEAMRYHERQYEDQLVAVPSWVLESLAYSAEIGTGFDPELLDTPNQTASLKSEPVSFSPLPSALDVMRFHDIPIRETVPSQTKEWAFRLKDGVKEYGPYGQKLAPITIFRSTNRVSPFQCKQYREQDTLKWLHSHGFGVRKEEDSLQVSSTHKVSPETLGNMMCLYGTMAGQIASTAAICNVLFTHRDNLEKELQKDAFKEAAKKLLVTHPHDDSLIPALAFLEMQTGKQAQEITWVDVQDYLVPEITEELKATIHTKVTARTYLLQVRSSQGYDTVRVTRDPDLAKEWRAAEAIDIPYFFARTSARQRLGRPSALRPANYNSLETGEQTVIDTLVRETKEAWIEETELSRARLQALIKSFNSNHKVKLIPSRAERATGWLLDDLPATTSQLSLQREALAQLGAKIVACRIRLGRIDETRKMAFRKLQGALKAQVLSGKLTKATLEKALTGEIALSYMFAKRKMPEDNKADTLVKSGVIYQSERNQSTYLHIYLSFNRVFTKHEEVFSIVPNFRPSNEVTRLVQIAIEKRHYL